MSKVEFTPPNDSSVGFSSNLLKIALADGSLMNGNNINSDTHPQHDKRRRLDFGSLVHGHKVNANTHQHDKRRLDSAQFQNVKPYKEDATLLKKFALASNLNKLVEAFR